MKHLATHLTDEHNLRKIMTEHKRLIVMVREDMVGGHMGVPKGYVEKLFGQEIDDQQWSRGMDE